jgi:hypothetical protein
MRKVRLGIVLCSLACIVFGMHYVQSQDLGDCTRGLRDRGIDNVEGLPHEENYLFAGSARCGGCHASDPAGITSVDNDGNDVNLTDDWRTSMMANSAKDPFWKAKVSHEVQVNPAHQGVLEAKCTSCHAPMGHFNAVHLGNGPYTMAMLAIDTVGLDGVSCSACHQLNPETVGSFFSGELDYDTNHVVYGPYENPYSSPMELLIGYSLEQHDYIGQSEACAGCHTLITGTVDIAGTPTGTDFVEQATYHEWVNSQYSAAGTEVTCQACHMPSIEDSVILSMDYAWVGGRSPFSKHYFVGANAFMLRILKNNADTLGIWPTPDLFDSTIARTLDLLQRESLDLSIFEDARTSDSVFYAVEITNKTGHKFPSGYPSRRAFVRMTVMDDVGDTIFCSGNWDNTYEVIGHDLNYEQHYNMINDEMQVQIYEMVMGDVNGNKTTVLERADVSLKDNRLVPKGFSSSHYNYDTVLIAGAATTDPNFNYVGTTEGSGADVVEYHVALNGYTGVLNVHAQVYYQTAPPAWMVEMFNYSSVEIDLFRTLYDNAEQTPILVVQERIGPLFTGIPERDLPPYQVYPNPTSDGVFRIQSGLNVQQLEMYDMTGKLVKTYVNPIAEYPFELPSTKGTYAVFVTFSNGQQDTKLMIRR